MSQALYSIAKLGQRLGCHKPVLYEPTAKTRQAATAVILCEKSSDIQVLFIKRASVNGDPWSGHMAFPGGHLETDDKDLLDAAMRETEEEVGFTLSTRDLVCPLSHQRAAPRGRTIDMIVAPYVFIVDAIPNFSLSHEVDEVVWGSFKGMMDGVNHTSETRPMAGSDVAFNGYRLSSNHFVWGLTYRTLQSLFTAADPAYTEPLDPVT